MKAAKTILLLSLGIHLLLVACSSNQAATPEPSVSPVVLSNTATVGKQGQPRLIPLRVTLSNPEDLKITQGDVIQKGQVLSDRKRERERVLLQLSQLQSNLKRLQAIAQINDGSRSSPQLPSPSYLEQQKGIESQQVALADIHTEIQNQELKLTQLGLMEELPESVVVHEQAILRQLQEKQRRQESAVKYSVAQLETKRQERKYQEYQHAIELEKKYLEATKQQQTLALNQSQILGEISRLEGELLVLSSVKSPFSGKVSRIQWVGQNDQSLTVELAIVVDPEQPKPVVPTSGKRGPTTVSRQ